MAFRPQMGGIGAMSGGMGGAGGGSGTGSMMGGTRPNAQLAQQLLMQNLIASDPALAANPTLAQQMTQQAFPQHQHHRPAPRERALGAALC